MHNALRGHAHTAKSPRHVMQSALAHYCIINWANNAGCNILSDVRNFATRKMDAVSGDQVLLVRTPKCSFDAMNAREQYAS